MGDYAEDVYEEDVPMDVMDDEEEGDDEEIVQVRIRHIGKMR